MSPLQADHLCKHFGVQAGNILSAECAGGVLDMGISDLCGQASAAFRASARQKLGYLDSRVARLREQEPQPSHGLTTASRPRDFPAGGAGGVAGGYVSPAPARGRAARWSPRTPPRR